MAPLSEKTISIVKSTAPVLAVHGTTITSTFYPILFHDFPEVKDLFNMRHQANDPNHPESSIGSQPRALAAAVHAYAANIDNLGALTEAVKLMAHKHAALHVLPKHYPMVGVSLLKAIKQVLGDAATDDIMNAWKEAYFFLADILIKAEDDLRKENEVKDHGWVGFKDMKVLKKVKEADDVYSFHIGNVDGSGICNFQAGQYLSFKMTAPNGTVQERNYSISCGPNAQHFRVSIKRVPNGIVSNWFHYTVQEGSIIQVAPPYGEFTLPEAPKDSAPKPIVLAAAGIGITPILSMAEHLAGAAGQGRQVYVLYGCRNGDLCPFGARLRELQAQHPNVHVHITLSQPKDTDVLGKTYDSKGHVNIDTVRAALKELRPADCDWRFCGPTEFMVDMRALLRWLNVPTANVHYECFRPLVGEIGAAA